MNKKYLYFFFIIYSYSNNLFSQEMIVDRDDYEIFESYNSSFPNKLIYGQEEYDNFIKSQNEYDIFYSHSSLTWIEIKKFQLKDNNARLFISRFSDVRNIKNIQNIKLNFSSKFFLDSIIKNLSHCKYCNVRFKSRSEGGLFISLKHKGERIYELFISNGSPDLISEIDRERIRFGILLLEELDRLSNGKK
jgi:hypothetical protein